MTDDLQARIDDLEARLAALEPKPKEVVLAWGDRTCQTCGEAGEIVLADVVDLDRPPEIPAQVWNGEGYCRDHADELGITADDHPHLTRPGPRRKT